MNIQFILTSCPGSNGIERHPPPRPARPPAPKTQAPAENGPPSQSTSSLSNLPSRPQNNQTVDESLGACASNSTSVSSQQGVLPFLLLLLLIIILLLQYYYYMISIYYLLSQDLALKS